jgi:hypothetical protein
MLEVFKEERAQLVKDIASNQRTVQDLKVQREAAWSILKVNDHCCRSLAAVTAVAAVVYLLLLLPGAGSLQLLTAITVCSMQVMMAVTLRTLQCTTVGYKTNTI